MNQEVVKRIQQWLGPKGIHFFRTLKKLKGTVSPVLKTKGPIPVHPVHLREGMKIRNWMRDQPEFKNYDAHDFDNNWAALVEKAIK